MDQSKKLDFTRESSLVLLGNAQNIAEVVLSGVCHRYPDLKFVSVENGAGWLPFLGESMDWQWLNVGAHKDYPERLLPSEYMRRQIYGMYWFEQAVDARGDRPARRQPDVRDRLPARHQPLARPGVGVAEPAGRHGATRSRGSPTRSSARSSSTPPPGSTTSIRRCGAEHRARRDHSELTRGAALPDRPLRRLQGVGHGQGARSRGPVELPRAAQYRPPPVVRRTLRIQVEGPLADVRAVEVASHVFVPMAGSVLTEWGAEVIKIEHPVEGDPYRGLVTVGLHNVYRGVDVFFQSANRGKRSVGIDLTRADGRDLLARIVATADVFLTNLRPSARRHLRIEVEDVRADNPDVVYVLGTAFGAKGPDGGSGAYDVGAYWARSGMQHLLTPPGAPWPTGARPAFGDVVGGLTIAGAVSAALYRRAKTGEPSVIHASLLASGMWQVQPDIVNAGLDAEPSATSPQDRYGVWNPLMLPYRTADGRFVALSMLDPGPPLAGAVPGRSATRRWRTTSASSTWAPAAPTPASAPSGSRVCSRRGRSRSGGDVLAGLDGEWAPVQTPAELHDDPQVLANGYIAAVDIGGGVAAPPRHHARAVRRPARPAGPGARARRAHRGRAARARPVLGRHRRPEGPAGAIL